MGAAKPVAVTGASRGIGAAISRELARRVFTVACLTGKSLGPEDGGPVTARFVNQACDVNAEEAASAAHEAVVTTNAQAAFVACSEAYSHLVASGGGLIVNLGSFFDRTGVKRSFAYCASKTAVGAITRCLAVEWADRNIRVLGGQGIAH